MAKHAVKVKMPDRLEEDHAELARLHGNLRADSVKAARLLNRLHSFHSRKKARAEQRGDEESAAKHGDICNRLKNMHSATVNHLADHCSHGTMKRIEKGE